MMSAVVKINLQPILFNLKNNWSINILRHIGKIMQNNLKYVVFSHMHLLVHFHFFVLMKIFRKRQIMMPISLVNNLVVVKERPVALPLIQLIYLPNIVVFVPVCYFPTVFPVGLVFDFVLFKPLVVKIYNLIL